MNTIQMAEARKLHLLKQWTYKGGLFLLQVSRVVTAELENMHCEACTEQLKEKIFKLTSTYPFLIFTFELNRIINGTLCMNLQLMTYLIRTSKSHGARKSVPFF